ncbi:hypothetical protein D3C87_1330180 [compost metagenome]
MDLSVSADRASNAEVTHHLLQLIPQPRQFDTGRRCLVAGRSGLFRHVAHVDDAAADLFGHGALLFGGSGDLLVHRLNRRDGAGDAFQ